MDNFDLKKFLAEGKLYEASIPSGWKKIDTSNDYEKTSQQGRLMGFEAPMNGIEGDEVDNIYIEQDGDEYEVHVMTAFNNPEYEGPFSSKEEALKVAIQKMEDLKKDWDEKDLGEGKLHEEAAGYDYASCDGETIELWSKESLNSYISDMAKDEYDGNKKSAVGYMKSEQMLTKLPNSPYLFIYANDESLDILDASNKEEFVTLIDDEFHGGLEGDVDAMFAKILSLADDSSISGDSQFQQIVIENGKVIGGRA